MLPNAVLFVGVTASGDVTLDVSDGTAAGTHEVTGIAGTYGTGFTIYDGEVLFAGFDASGDGSLWVTDGTAAGTHEVTGIAGADPSGLEPSDLTAYDGELLFEGVDAEGDYGLWASDSTAAGTYELTGIAGAYGSGLYPSGLTVYNGEVLFAGLDASGDYGLWATDGTAAGTRELTSIAGANASGLSPGGFTLYDGEVLFDGLDAEGNYGLWVTDGTSAGTHELIGVAGMASNGVEPDDAMIVGDGEVLFVGVDASGDEGLWVTNGTAAGTHELTGIAGANTSGLDPSDLTSFNGEALFAGLDASGAEGLWVTNGTAAGTREVTTAAGDPANLTAYNGEALFAGQGGLWVTDGTAAGTHEVATEWNPIYDMIWLTPPDSSSIPSNATTLVAQVGDLYELEAVSAGTGPLIEINGGLVVAGQFAAGWTPVAAVQTGDGYEVAWTVPGQNEYTVWNTDGNGDYTSPATGILTPANSTAMLQGLEAIFGEDFAGLTPASAAAIATNDVTTLAQVGNLFELNPSGGGTGPLLQLNGSIVSAGQFAAGWTPVGAVQTGAGYEVAWSVPGANEYEIWNTDGSGNFTGAATGVLSGSSPTLEAVEAYFGETSPSETFPGAGQPASAAIIATNGATTLTQVGNLFELAPSGGGTGPALQLNGAFVIAGQFAAGWTPVGAKQTGSGYEVAWSVPGANEYVVWNTNSNGNYTGAASGILTGASPTLEAVEANFGETSPSEIFSGAGPPASTAAIASNGVTTLAQVGNLFELNPSSGGAGPLLQLGGDFVTVGQFAAGWSPVGAIETGDGYEVAWSVPGANEYEIWNTDSNGNYDGAATGVLTSANSAATLEGLEANFGEEFAGLTPASAAAIATNGVTTLAQVGNLFELNPSGGGAGPLLQLNGSLVTAGQFAAGWTPVGAAQTGYGYEVAWSVPGANAYEVWDTDGGGDYTGAATGLLSGASSTLEAVEAYFGETFAGASPPASGITPAPSTLMHRA